MASGILASGTISTDVITNVLSANPYGSTGVTIMYINNIYMCFYLNGEGSIYYTSTDCITWTLRSLPILARVLSSFVANNTCYIVLQADGVAYVWASSNGTSFSSYIYQSNTISYVPFWDVYYVNNRYYFNFYSPEYLMMGYTSDPLYQPTYHTLTNLSTSYSSVGSLVYLRGEYLFGNYRSTDGINFSVYPSNGLFPFMYQAPQVIYSVNGRYYFVNARLTTTDGITFSPTNITTGGDRSILYISGVYLCNGMRSADGINFMFAYTAIINSIRGNTAKCELNGNICNVTINNLQPVYTCPSNKSAFIKIGGDQTNHQVYIKSNNMNTIINVLTTNKIVLGPNDSLYITQYYYPTLSYTVSGYEE